MASAVAVDASSSAPRLPNNLDSDAEITGKVGSPLSDEDEQNESPRHASEDNGVDEDDEDLFGDDDEMEQPPKTRKLDDEELDSGDDEGRTDRLQDDDEEAPGEFEQQLSYMEADLARHPIPEPSDKELYLLKVPRFLSIEPVVWNHRNYQPPTTDHHSKGAPSDTFSAFNTAMTTIRWRRSPSNLSELQSNARILRWSDGSLTLQFASDPMNQYEINANELAPPQHNPNKHTPTSIHYQRGRPPAGADSHKESYTYLAAPYESASIMRFTNKLTTALSVVAAADSKDAALAQLQNALAAAATRGREEGDNAISFIQVNQDPEVKKMQAEAAHREKLRQQRTREKHEQRERERSNKAFGGRGTRPGVGLSVGALEDDELGGGRRTGVKKSRPKTGLRRDWSDDEDYGIRGKTREDEYDEEDDFIAASDEEEMVEDEDEDEDDGIVEAPRERTRDTQSPKRNRANDDEGDGDEVVGTANRTKRRRVVEEDDDDE